MSRLSAKNLASVLLRSFFLQASWNFERLQNLGALFALAPALRRIYPPEQWPTAYRRHLEYFNTHPFMAGPVLGTTLALEEEAAENPDAPDVAAFRDTVMAPYAAMGDSLFWGGLRPLAAGIALFFAAKGSLLAPLVFLLVFNLPNLWLRTAGLFRGYRQGLAMVEWLQTRRLPDLAVRCKEATVVLLGALSAYLAFTGCRDQGLDPWWGLVLLPLLAAVVALVRRGWSTLLLVMMSGTLVLVLVKVFMEFKGVAG